MTENEHVDLFESIDLYLSTEIETVDGIKWSYIVKDGEAEIFKRFPWAMQADTVGAIIKSAPTEVDALKTQTPIVAKLINIKHHCIHTAGTCIFNKFKA